MVSSFEAYAYPSAHPFSIQCLPAATMHKSWSPSPVPALRRRFGLDTREPCMQSTRL